MTRIEVMSPDFQDGESMPARFAAEGGNISPPIFWGELPAGIKSLALIVDDIDIPLPKFIMQTWVHWVVFDIPTGSKGLPEGIPVGAAVPGGGTQGRTSFHTFGWGGPAPVGGEHRYVFRLYALDCSLGMRAKRATKKALVSVMAGHIVGQGELVGKYRKRG
jgi:Raf kinase inhibitor-like YbhB/YbcL family protein